MQTTIAPKPTTTTTTITLKRNRDPSADVMFQHVQKVRKLMEDPAPKIPPIRYDADFAVTDAHRDYKANFTISEINLINYQRIQFVQQSDRKLFQLNIDNRIVNDPKILIRGKHTAKYWDDCFIFAEQHAAIAGNKTTDVFLKVKAEKQFRVNYILQKSGLLRSRTKIDFGLLRMALKKYKTVEQRTIFLMRENIDNLRMHFAQLSNWAMTPKSDNQKKNYHCFLYYDLCVFGANTWVKQFMKWLVLENDITPVAQITLPTSARAFIKDVASLSSKDVDRIHPHVYYYQAINKEFKFIFPPTCQDKLTLLGKLNYHKAGFINKHLKLNSKSQAKFISFPQFYE